MPSLSEQQQLTIEYLERELSFRQLQISRLLAVTQSINNNVPAEELFTTYNSIMGFDMAIRKMVLLTRAGKYWQFATGISVSRQFARIAEEEDFSQFQRSSYIDDDEHPFLREFDIVIPVYHKDNPIAMAFVGGVTREEDVYEKVRFISTITNIIAVAIENKRLFKQQVEQESMRLEMDVARQVQAMLIPKSFPSTERYEIDGVYMPHSSVGGDYFDIIEISEHEIVLCIADVSGKGVPAALLMSNFQANLQTLIHKRLAPAKFIELLNRATLRITKGERFITFFAARLNFRDRTMRYVNAGHNPPILLTPDGLQLLSEGCTVLGAFEELPRIGVGEIPLPPDALLIAYTDGLTELRNFHDDFFGEEHLYAFAELHADRSAKAFNAELLEHILAFKGDTPFTDDISVLTCKLYNPPPPNIPPK